MKQKVKPFGSAGFGVFRGQAKPVAAVLNLFRLLDRDPELLGELKT